MKKSFVMVLGLVVTAALFAQQPAATSAAPKAAPTAAPARSANLPSKETVEEFMRHTFGYDQNLKWQVREIKPASDPSMTEITVLVNTPDGRQMLKLVLTPDGKNAIRGEFVPFGADPFASMRQELEAKAKGPSRGAASPELTIVEFGDLQ